MANGRQVLGTLGEQAACALLERDGYTILHRNYRVRSGEIDIVCEQGSVLVFCEVKTRTSAAYGLPEEAVTGPKRVRLRRLALEYLRRERGNGRPVRFDVVSVTVTDGRIGTVRHLVSAF